MDAKKMKYDPVRAVIVEILGLIEKGRFTAEEAIHKAIENGSYTPRDIRFIRQMVNGTTKMKRRLDHDLKFYLSKPSEKLPQRLTDILRLGLFQILFTERIPDAAVVSEAVNLARHFCDQPRARLVNAVLRTALRHPEKVAFRNKAEEPTRHLADYYSYPEWFVEYCLSEFKLERTEQLLAAMNRPPLLSFRVNTIKETPENIIRRLDESGAAYKRGRYLDDFFHLEESGFPLDDDLLDSGRIYIQDESAGMAVYLLNPRIGGNVLDLGAAPGGKSAYAAMLMNNRGMITAVDKSHPRLKLMLENCRRLGIEIVSPVLADILEFRGRPFERVILDAPCTGWGNAGKHSDLRWMKKPDDVTALARLQTRMIDKAASLVKPGGVLVYATCTIIRKENDDVIEEFLVRNGDFILETAGRYFDREVVSERGFVKTYPYKEGLSGAFSARLRRRPEK